MAVLCVRRAEGEDAPTAVPVVARVLVVPVALADGGRVAGPVGDFGKRVRDVLVERPVEARVHQRVEAEGGELVGAGGAVVVVVVNGDGPRDDGDVAGRGPVLDE